MKLILKIAVGVFLGLGALLLVIKAPGWVSQWIRESRNSRASYIVFGLTPAKLSTLCGEPQHDTITPGYVAERHVSYMGKGALSGTGFIFYEYTDEQQKKGWQFNHATLDSKDGLVLAEFRDLDDYTLIVNQRLPCLEHAK